MMPALVITATELTRSLADEVAHAARQLGAQLFRWEQNASQQPFPAEPSLVIGMLAAGERKIPRGVVDLITTRCPAAKVLLLCQEPLLKNSVTLNDGRVTLIGTPLGIERIAGSMSRLIADKKPRRIPTVELFPALANPTGPVVVRERLRADYWIGRVGCSDPADESSRVHLPVIHEDPADGLLAMLPTSVGSGLAREEAISTAHALRQGSADEQREQAVAAVVAERAGIVHMSPASDAWTFYWPHAQAPLWIYSPQRLPNWWDLRSALQTQGRRLCTLPAHAADVVVAASSASPFVAGDDPAGLEGALANGVPMVMELVERSLRASPRLFSGMLVEVR